jgi:hypothetical protein
LANAGAGDVISPWPTLIFATRRDDEGHPIVLRPELIDRLSAVADGFSRLLPPCCSDSAVRITCPPARAGFAGICVAGWPNERTYLLANSAGLDEILLLCAQAPDRHAPTIHMQELGIEQARRGVRHRGATLIKLANEIGHLPDDLSVLIIAEVDPTSLPRKEATGDLRRVEQPIQLPPAANTTCRRLVESFAYAAHTALRRLCSDLECRRPAP